MSRRDVSPVLLGTAANRFVDVDVLGDLDEEPIVLVPAGLPAACFSTSDGSAWLNAPAKRFLDIAVALAIVTIAAPLLLIVALLIKVTSRGPVIYRQLRTGLNGESFVIFKFRSMYTADDQALMQATKGDARVTPIGRILRRTSIDELPQLINVIQGRMSLVGPRPHALQHDSYYGSRLPNYHLRFAARPGLSGLAQVSGARGETPTCADMDRRLQYDLTYVSQASLRLDLRILYASVREITQASAY